MNTKEYLSLSTRLAKDLKEWIERSTERGGVSTEQLALLTRAAEIIDDTTLHVTEQATTTE